MVLYILTGYQVLSIVYFDQQSCAHHTHILSRYQTHPFSDSLLIIFDQNTMTHSHANLKVKTNKKQKQETETRNK